ncbi:MAG: SDR family oxidoreductase [Dehalococcoidia bacterium]|nr:SDR family oxidoreductase [Dehalococcoidia bacterium]
MVREKFELAGKTAAVTGAGRGIGAEMACALAHAGADLVLAARTEGQLEAVAARVREIGRRAEIVTADVSDPIQCERIVERCMEAFGRIDVMLSNAGGGSPAAMAKSVVATPDDDWRSMIELNLYSAFYCARAAARRMVESGSGVIINVSSGAAMRGHHTHAYAAAKAGVISLTKSLALELARHNVRANVIVPGVVAQEGRSEERNRQRAARGAYIPVGRIGQVTELGPLAVFLASDASSYITGQSFVIDGGGLSGGITPGGWEPRTP